MSRTYDHEQVTLTFTYADWTLVLAALGRERERVYAKADRQEKRGDFVQADGLRERGRRVSSIQDDITSSFYELRQARRSGRGQ